MSIQISKLLLSQLRIICWWISPFQFSEKSVIFWKKQKKFFKLFAMHRKNVYKYLCIRFWWWLILKWLNQCRKRISMREWTYVFHFHLFINVFVVRRWGIFVRLPFAPASVVYRNPRTSRVPCAVCGALDSRFASSGVDRRRFWASFKRRLQKSGASHRDDNAQYNRPLHWGNIGRG